MRIKEVISLLLVLAASARSAYAQEPSTPETQWGNYSVRSEAEIGWRWLELRGSRDKYRSDLNLGRGPRLFGLALQFTGSYRVAILSLMIFVVSGIALLSKVDVLRAVSDAGTELPA